MTTPSPISWILVGTGDIVQKRVAPALAGRIAAVVGSPGRAEELAAKWKVPLALHNLDEALRRCDAPAVYVATPVHRHHDEALTALNANRHVLIEKPLALNFAQAGELVAAVRPGQKAGCAYYRRFFPRFSHLQSVLEKHELGKIVHVSMTNMCYYKPEKSDPKYWRTVREKSGGGTLADVGVHMFDLLIAALGLPTHVFAKCDHLVHDYQVEDSSTMLMTLAGGARVSATFGWSTKSWRHEMEVVGSEGKILWSPADTGKVLYTLGRQTQELDFPNAANVHQPLVDDFEQAIRENRQPICTLEQAAKTNRLLDAIYRSAASGREETV